MGEGVTLIIAGKGKIRCDIIMPVLPAAEWSLYKTDYFEVEVENGRIMLTPVRMQQADAVRAKLE